MKKINNIQRFTLVLRLLLILIFLGLCIEPNVHAHMYEDYRGFWFLRRDLEIHNHIIDLIYKIEVGILLVLGIIFFADSKNEWF